MKCAWFIWIRGPKNYLLFAKCRLLWMYKIAESQKLFVNAFCVAL